MDELSTLTSLYALQVQAQGRQAGSRAKSAASTPAAAAAASPQQCVIPTEEDPQMFEEIKKLLTSRKVSFKHTHHAPVKTSQEVRTR